MSGEKLADSLKALIEAAGYEEGDVTAIRYYARGGRVQFITSDGVKHRKVSEASAKAAPAKKTAAKKA